MLLLGVPLVLGMVVARRPALAAGIRKPMKWLSLLVLAGFIVGALAANFKHFVAYIHFVVLVVFRPQPTGAGPVVHLSARPGAARARDRRAITFEMGIQGTRAWSLI